MSIVSEYITQEQYQEILKPSQSIVLSVPVQLHALTSDHHLKQYDFNETTGDILYSTYNSHLIITSLGITVINCPVDQKPIQISFKADIIIMHGISDIKSSSQNIPCVQIMLDDDLWSSIYLTTPTNHDTLIEDINNALASCVGQTCNDDDDDNNNDVTMNDINFAELTPPPHTTNNYSDAPSYSHHPSRDGTITTTTMTNDDDDDDDNLSDGWEPCRHDDAKHSLAPPRQRRKIHDGTLEDDDDVLAELYNPLHTTMLSTPSPLSFIGDGYSSLSDDHLHQTSQSGTPLPTTAEWESMLARLDSCLEIPQEYQYVVNDNDDNANDTIDDDNHQKQ